MLEIRSVTETWESIVLVDGLKAARGLVDTRTDLECVTYALDVRRRILSRHHVSTIAMNYRCCRLVINRGVILSSQNLLSLTSG